MVTPRTRILRILRTHILHSSIITAIIIIMGMGRTGRTTTNIICKKRRVGVSSAPFTMLHDKHNSRAVIFKPDGKLDPAVRKHLVH